MELSVSSGKFGILQRATFLTFGDSVDHTTDYPLNDMVASANEWTTKVATKIWRSSLTWEYDDSNQSDLNIYTATLVNNQQDYSLPATTLKVYRVEVMDSGGNWVKLTPIDQTEVSVALTELEPNAGIPWGYDIMANSLMLYPAPASGSVTLSGGLKIYIAREGTTFTVPASYTTADTTQPGFDEDFHDAVCYGIAHDWLRSNGEQVKANDYMTIINGMFADVAQRYGQKNPDKKVGLRPRRENYS